MSKFNTVPDSSGPSSPLKTLPGSRTATYEGGPAVRSDKYTEAFRLGVNLFGGNEPTFYEKGKSRDNRFNTLIAELAIEDPTWTVGFLVWLRKDANIRTAAIMGAAHAIHARLNNANSVQEDELLSSQGYTGLNRYLVNNVCQRADEPGEFTAYWTRTFGGLPKPVKRGLGDAAKRLYTEYATLKYNTDSHAVKFSDVLNLTHVKPDPETNQPDIFSYIINDRYGNDQLGGLDLPMVTANKLLRQDAVSDPAVLLDAHRLERAGFTWEDALSLAGARLPKGKVWEAIGPNMPYMAKLRNLRNFEQEGTSTEFKTAVAQHIMNPRAVEKSRQFPFRFLSAFNEVNSLQFQAALETALETSVQNIPELDGDTLVLVDTSGSMSATISGNSKMTRAGVGALFGAALANKNAGHVDLVMYATTSKAVKVPVGGSVLNIVKEIDRRNGQVGHGTQTADAIRTHLKSNHKRVVVFTDGQSFGGYYGMNIGDVVPKDVFLYAFDLAGYRQTDLETGKRRIQLGGLTDATFKMIDLYERGENANWPWLQK